MTLIGAKVFAEESRAYEARKRIVDSANSIIEALPAVASVRVYRVDDLDGKPRFSSDVTFAKVDRPWCAEELALPPIRDGDYVTFVSAGIRWEDADRPETDVSRMVVHIVFDPKGKMK